MFSSLYYAGLRASGVTAIARALRDGGLVVCYHNVVRENIGSGFRGTHLPFASFSRQIQWLAGHYDVVSLDEIGRRLEARKSLKHLAAITFDDGYAGVFEHAWPLLRGMGLPATVFIPTGLMNRDVGFWWDHPSVSGATSDADRQRMLFELRGDADAIAAACFDKSLPVVPATHRPVDWATVARAATEGLALGVHTTTHRNLARLTDGELDGELVESRDRLERETGVRSNTFAYPYGLFDARVKRAVQESGYRLAVGLEPGLNTNAVDPWALRRVNVPASISDAAFEAWLAVLQPTFRRS